MIIRFWANLALSLFSIQLKVNGLQNVPHGSCLFLFNHMSFYDIFLCLLLWMILDLRKNWIVSYTISVGGDEELGILPIARDDRGKVIEVYQQAQDRVLRGERFVFSSRGDSAKWVQVRLHLSQDHLFCTSNKIQSSPGLSLVLMKSQPGQLIPNLDRQERSIQIEILPLFRWMRTLWKIGMNLFRKFMTDGAGTAIKTREHLSKPR